MKVEHQTKAPFYNECGKILNIYAKYESVLGPH